MVSPPPQGSHDLIQEAICNFNESGESVAIPCRTLDSGWSVRCRNLDIDSPVIIAGHVIRACGLIPTGRLLRSSCRRVATAGAGAENVADVLMPIELIRRRDFRRRGLLGPRAQLAGRNAESLDRRESFSRGAAPNGRGGPYGPYDLCSPRAARAPAIPTGSDS